MTNAAFYFEEEAYSLGGAQIVGRQSAGHGFLRAFAQHANVGALYGYSTGQSGVDAFERFVRPLRPNLPVHGLTVPTLTRLQDVGCLFYPGPDLAQQAWRREFFGSASWSLCGITHTLATKRVMESIVELLAAPVEPWDAVVCTSTAAREVVTGLLEAQGEWLAARLGATALRLPRLPVIPLGVDCDTYAFSAEERARARQTLGLETHDIAVLYVGRMSFRAKAHPLAMYRALAMASGGHRVVLIEAGQFANERAAAAFTEARAALCGDLAYRALDGRDSAAWRNAWAAADVFCSLSDNIQETFGLTPIEAMAAGLPVVVSDWDGYRDTVRDGVDGYRIPTLMPVPGAGQGLAIRHALDVDDYNQYIGLLSQFTAVDIEAAAQAFRLLFADPQLRRQMGLAGRQRAREVYDWRHVVAAYQALWGELAQERAPHANATPRRWPARMDPFAVFASFPSAKLGPDAWLQRTGLDSAAVARLRGLAVVSFASPALPPAEAISNLLARVPADAPVRLRSILAAVPHHEQAWMMCTIAWLAKLGALRVSMSPR